MNNMEPPFDELNASELSEEDLAILQAFEAMDSWPPQPAHSTPIPDTPVRSASPSPRVTGVLSQDSEMLSIFLEEAEEDLARMRQALRQLEETSTPNPARFTPLLRAGHKLRGTAGAVDFSLTSLIAGQIEDIAERASHQALSPSTSLLALSSAFTALEHCLQRITATTQEPEERDILLAALAATYQDLGIDLSIPLSREPLAPPSASSITAPLPALQDELPDLDAEEFEDPLDEEELAGMTVHIPAHATQKHSPVAPSVRVDARRLDKLSAHSAYLIEQRNVLENALQQVDIALQEFQAAQSRLQQLEPLLPIFLETSFSTPAEATSPSSLISRILSETSLRQPSARTQKSRPASLLDPEAWDEMNIERYSEKDKLFRSLREAIVDLNITSARLQSAYADFAMLQQEYLTRISSLRRDTLSMRQAPFSTLVPRLARVVKMSTLGQPVRFSVTGESIEFDQDELEQLTRPLIQLLRTCMADAFLREGESNESGVETDAQKGKPPRIWLSIRERGSETVLEVGFSITIQGGAVAPLRSALQRLGGHLSLWRNTAGGVSFLLHIPRALSTTRCLMLCAGDQQLIVPFAQIQRVIDRHQDESALPDSVYCLNALMGIPESTAPLVERPARPVLLVAFDHPEREVGVAVDQVIDEVELIVKPLKPYLQRPGIPGAAVDGKGHVMLMLDLPALIEQYNRGTQHNTNITQVSPNSRRPHQARILVADDSAYLRHSVRQTLEYNHYTMIEAHDGMEALESLQKDLPDLCLLDIEMPNLNGYDVLSTIRNTPALAGLKVIMLTSRSSEKHRLHALELGADAYLTKPCPQELLLETVHRLLSIH